MPRNLVFQDGQACDREYRAKIVETVIKAERLNILEDLFR